MSLWTGRFAPTPSGPLHFGSLVAALGSYLVAKHQNGRWLVRIEDLDPPREQAGAAESIIRTLEVFGFEWDGPIEFQSQNSERYREALMQLDKLGITYRCDCSRQLVNKRSDGVYDGYCRERLVTEQTDFAVRIKFDDGFEQFTDQILGECHFARPADKQDFVIKRKDGLWAYQLAVVVDDIAQQIDHVVRGADILDSTPRQNYLYHCFQKQSPRYFHLPLVIDNDGYKFSKSKLYPAIEPHLASVLLVKALHHLGQKTVDDLDTGKPGEILKFAIANWQLNTVGKQAKVADLRS
ncbi:tRNA glutamyl-Q(34) synthetase GluQRS [Aliikangiella sp. G2MR2-5]|uniref:tRNA glutamyl-Q(34) synthetase GluQRS n=1 Tax=Aliikangiella sp. G2MR2-5 TaxID=2788943 RepID=UPI0018AC1904|nr:tRNA glutamyl-Q(34) synthetase GluQRS [Aliikangiella sp. G2MR2-5]